MLNELRLPLTGMLTVIPEILANSKLEVAHSDYQRHLFDDSFTRNKRQFQKYIRAMRQDSTGISTLFSNGKRV